MHGVGAFQDGAVPGVGQAHGAGYPVGRNPRLRLGRQGRALTVLGQAQNQTSPANWPGLFGFGLAQAR